MKTISNLWINEESQLTNYAYKEKILCLTLNPPENSFELCWTDYYSESGFEKIEKGSIENEEEIEQFLKDIDKKNVNIHLTIFGNYEHKHNKKINKLIFTPTHVYK